MIGAGRASYRPSRETRRRDAWAVFSAWLGDPRTIATVTPSSASLARLITSRVTAATGAVIELGPGTGVFTEALLSRGVPEDRLFLFEQSQDFVALLRERFPAATVVNGPAEAIMRHSERFPTRPGATVSGLPLLAMAPAAQQTILGGAFEAMKDAPGGGAFYQFTYGHVPPARAQVRAALGLRAERIGTTLCNLPPASVYRFTRA